MLHSTAIISSNTDTMKGAQILHSDPSSVLGSMRGVSIALKSDRTTYCN